MERIVTPRLVLDPVTEAVARAIVAGDHSAVIAGEGWPHEDTVDGIGTVLQGAQAWLVLLDGVVIGDCGRFGEDEIGYGLAAPYRGRGYGGELVVALSRWVLAQPGVRRVIARGVLVDNVPSRRALLSAGFVATRDDGKTVDYARE
jgi:RimJ/RimL family protein N-acetyltransferase